MIYTKEQEKQITVLRARFVKLHGKGAWAKLKYCINKELRETEIVQIMARYQKDRSVVRHWRKKILNII